MATSITISTGGTTTVVTVPETQNNVTVSRNQITTDERTKLAGIEAGATGDMTDAEIKTAYENNADTNAFTDADQTKLAGVEAGATADQTDFEIKTAYENNSNTNAFTDAEQTKLASIEADADVTDAANVASAGAVMNTGNETVAGVKTFSSTISGSIDGNAATVTNGVYTTSSIGDLSDVSTSGISDDNVLVSDGSGNFTAKSTFEAFLSSASQYNTDVNGPLPGVAGDINGDGIVNTSDLLAFLASFGTNIDLDGYVKALFTTDGLYVDLQSGNSLTTSTYNGQSSTGISNLKTLDLTAPTDSDNYGSFAWTHNAQNDTVDFLSGVNGTDWHLDSKIIIQETSRIQVDLGSDVPTWIAVYMHIVNEYPSDADRTFTVLLGLYTFESNGFINLPTGVVNGNSSYNPSIQDQDKFFVKSTQSNQRPTNIKISLHAGCPSTQENGHVNLKITDFKFKISN